MSENQHEQQQGQPEEKKGAFGKDKAFGNRIDLVFAIGEPFLVLGAKIEEETIPTTYGDAEAATLLCQKINPDTGAPQGPPLRCVTVASAIVEKAKELQPDELAAGPVCQLQVVMSKKRKQNALVLSWMRNLADTEDYSDFGISEEEVFRVRELTRPEGERINF